MINTDQNNKEGLNTIENPNKSAVIKARIYLFGILILISIVIYTVIRIMSYHPATQVSRKIAENMIDNPSDCTFTKDSINITYLYITAIYTADTFVEKVLKNDILENKKCGIKININKFENTMMIAPDTFVFSDDDIQIFKKAYKEAFIIPQEKLRQHIEDSILDSKQKNILSKLCN